MLNKYWNFLRGDYGIVDSFPNSEVLHMLLFCNLKRKYGFFLYEFGPWKTPHCSSLVTIIIPPIETPDIRIWTP